ncbi:MAG: glutamate--tRNA ligase, partial [Dehalococcoidales bacterium]|nr:glutamate--tRNA ligase [Dehalococcoidales bacterium]
ERDLPPDVERPLDEDYVRSIIPLVQERARTLVEITDLTVFFFVDKLEYATADLIIKGSTQQFTYNAYLEAEKIIDKTPFNAGELEKEFRALADRLGLKAGQLFSSLRIAMTGRTVSPPLFQTMEVLGKERVQKRMQVAVNKLKQMTA